MDEPGSLVPRSYPSGSQVEVLSTRSGVLPLDIPPREPHLLDYLMILRKQKWLILSFLLTVVTIVSIATFRMQPVYQAAAHVEIDPENKNILPFAPVDALEIYLDMQNYLETQAKILQSETLALQTIQSMGLAELPEFGGQPGMSSRLVLASGTAANQQRPPALGSFLGRLSVRRVPNSRLLEVAFESSDPNLAARVVNAHLENFIEQNFRSKFETTTQASKWLANQLDELKISVEKSEDNRIGYERQHQIWTIDEKQNITTQKLAELNRELTEAQASRMKKESIYQLAHSGSFDALPAIRDNELVKNLLSKKTDLTAQYAEALNTYGPNYPKVLRLQAQLKEMDELLANEKTNVVNRIDADYLEARRHELLLSRALEKQKAEADSMAEKMVQYNILKRDAEANKQLYEGLLQKLKEAGISAGLRSGNIHVVDPAMVPSGPSRPQKTRNILLSFLFGLVGGIGLALLREYLDNTVKTPDDVESLARLPSLAVVPSFATLNGRGRMSKLLRSSADDGTQTRVELVSHHMPQSQISEAFRVLRTSLLLSQAERPPQVILVTSALPLEGKTTAAVNLGVTLAQHGDRTLLLDADLRKPGIGGALNLAGGKYAGLSSYLAGVSSLELVAVPHPAIENLVVITSGPIPPNPAELLASRRMSEALTTLRHQYKFIVVDSPPVMMATDPVLISVLADGVLLVVRSGETPKQAFIRARELLVGVKCRLLGAVLNSVDTASPSYYYFHHKYPYAYGQEEDHTVEPKANS